MSLLRPKIRFRPLRKAVAFAAIGFGLGLSPVAPGTVGSLLGCLIVWGFTAAALPLWAQIAACAALSLLCIPIASVGESELGRGKDPGAVVCDEYLTFPICMIGLLDQWQERVWLMPLCFVVARALDIRVPSATAAAEADRYTARRDASGPLFSSASLMSRIGVIMTTDREKVMRMFM